MAGITVSCATCGASKTFEQREVGDLVAAFQQGDGEAIRCPTCETSWAEPLQRALNLSPAVRPLRAEGQRRRQYVRLSFELQASWRLPEGRESQGQVKNLSDGGLLLLTQEILPSSTPLRVDLRTRQGVRIFEGDVVWNDTEHGSVTRPIAHGIRFAGPVAEGLAEALFMLEATPR